VGVGVTITPGACICKRLWSPGIDSEESISPAYVACLAGTTNRVVVPGPPGWESILGLLKRSINTGSDIFIRMVIFSIVLYDYVLVVYMNSRQIKNK
jgi:hypothetical protein